MKYRKKPVVIEAIRYRTLGDAADINEEWEQDFKVDNFDYTLAIPTLEGVMTAKPGDYIIKGVNGEFYPCKPDIFEKTYDKVEE